MPQRTWSAKRERQYEHNKESLIDRGKKEAVAEERGLKGRSKMNKAQLESALQR